MAARYDESRRDDVMREQPGAVSPPILGDLMGMAPANPTPGNARYRHTGGHLCSRSHMRPPSIILNNRLLSRIRG